MSDLQPLDARDSRSRSRIPAKIDASPIPNYRGQFVSLGARANWRKPAFRRGFIFGAVTQPVKPEVKENCSEQAIVHYATLAPDNFAYGKSGLLYGIKTHTPATRVGDSPGYNSCALVVHAILKKAGCKWSKYSANAKAVYDMAYRAGWRPAKVQKAGCLVAWNSIAEGKRPRIGRGAHYSRKKRGGVYYRHLGITTGEWMAMDNSSVFSQPTEFITTRPFRYEEPLFLCPPDKSKAGVAVQAQKAPARKKRNVVKRARKKKR
ncbi:MAG: hypothetical protein ACR2OX_05070 [Methyloligellaceae bacterium]